MMFFKNSLISNDKTHQKVCSNIRLLGIVLCAFCLQSTLAYSQESSQTQVLPEPETGQSDIVTVDNSAQELKAGQSETVIVDNSAQAEDNSPRPASSASQGEDGVIRIEDTIRGNKEQPQVLTIVPWQLPVHQRINENTEWQLQVNQLTSIERSAFLRNLAVVNELKRAQKGQQ